MTMTEHRPKTGNILIWIVTIILCFSVFYLFLIFDTSVVYDVDAYYIDSYNFTVWTPTYAISVSKRPDVLYDSINIDGLTNTSGTIPQSTSDTHVFPGSAVITQNGHEYGITETGDGSYVNGVKQIETNIVAPEGGVLYSAPDVQSDFKAWMCALKLNQPSTIQYKMQRYNSNVFTDEYGLRRFKHGNDYLYCVAVGSYYAKKAGVRLDVYLDSGKVLKCVTSDVKADIHTNPETHQYRFNQGTFNVVEFLVNCDKMPKEPKRAGSYHVVPGFEGRVIGIVVYSDIQVDYVSTHDPATTDAGVIADSHCTHKKKSW